MASPYDVIVIGAGTGGYVAAIRAAQRIGAGATFFTHLNHDYDHDRAQADLPPGMFLAYDGLKGVAK